MPTILSLRARRETHCMRWAALLAALLAWPAVAQAPSVTLIVSPRVVASNGLVTVTVANGPATLTDWVALAVAGSDDTSYLAWDYLNSMQTPPGVGLSSASVVMTAPASPGSYEARFYYNNGFTVLARIPFTVQGAALPPPPPAAIAVNGSTNAVVSEGSALTVTVANGPATLTDWVALAVAGSDDTSYLAWAYLRKV